MPGDEQKWPMSVRIITSRSADQLLYNIIFFSHPLNAADVTHCKALRAFPHWRGPLFILHVYSRFCYTFSKASGSIIKLAFRDTTKKWVGSTWLCTYTQYTQYTHTHTHHLCVRWKRQRLELNKTRPFNRLFWNNKTRTFREKQNGI